MAQNRRSGRVARKRATPNTRVQSKAVPAPKAASWGDVKNHPIAVVALAILGTFGATYQWGLPLFTATQTEKIRALTAERDSNIARVGELTRALDVAERVRASAVLQAREIETADPFRDNDVFPLALRDVTIGTSEADFLRRFPHAEYNKVRTFASAELPDHAVFHQATYYFDDGQPNVRRVTHILYFFQAQPDNPLAVEQTRLLVLAALQRHFGKSAEFVDPRTGGSSTRWEVGTYVVDVEETSMHISGTAPRSGGAAIRGKRTART